MKRESVFILQAIVRPLITLMFAVTVVVGFIIGKLSTDAFLGVAGMSIAFWFQRREQQTKKEDLTSAS